jgi:tRNA-uridine 2-sulfurtransferase
MRTRKKVLVAMSGGVDSSVAAYLLKAEGYDVTGVTMCLGITEDEGKKPKCCGPKGIEDAKKVCLKLDIPHHVFDFSKHLEESVIDRFVSQYASGKTPNPCVDCNKSLKFGALLDKALSLGFQFLATGHYAKIEKKKKAYFLKRGRDRKKDQSYFLYAVKKDALKSILFPLAGLTKDKVRDIARKITLPVSEKSESQDLCFIRDGNYHDFLSGRIKKRVERGPVLDLKNRILGEHKGAFFYTVGQRGGLGIVGHSQPLYVLAVNTEKNQLVVGTKEDLKAKGLIAGDVNLLVGRLPKKALAKIRYNHKEAECNIFPEREKVKVIFKVPQEAVTPGQSVVFYDKNVILGGGVIEKAVTTLDKSGFIG